MRVERSRVSSRCLFIVVVLVDVAVVVIVGVVVDVIVVVLVDVVSFCRHYRLVHALPVVGILTLAPFLCECLLALLHRHRVIEIPCAFSALHVRSGRSRCGRSVADVCSLSAVALRLLFELRQFFLFLFFLQRLYYAVNGRIAVGFAHERQLLQRVLQMYVVCMRSEFVEHLRALRQLFVVIAVFIEQTYRLAITASCVAEFLQLPVEVAQMQQQHTFFYARACRLLVAFLVCVYSRRRILFCQIHIAHGVVHLVEIFCVVVRACHASQMFYSAFCVSGRHHFRHSDSGVKLQFVWRIKPYYVFECVVRFGVLLHGCIYLSEQEPLSRLLFCSHLVANHFSQIHRSFLQISRVQVVVSQRVIPFLLRSPVDAVAVHIAYYILRIVHPILLNIAFCEPCTCFAVYGWLGFIEA